MGLHTTTIAVCDPKPLCQAWALGSRSVLFRKAAHYFHDLSALKAGRGPCVFHMGRECRVRKNADIVVIGLPCQPFSVQRGDRGATVAQAHPAFAVMLEFLEYTASHQIHGGIVEEVMGFGHEIAPSKFRPTALIPHKPKSLATYFTTTLRSQGYFVAALKLDNAWWSDASSMS